MAIIGDAAQNLLVPSLVVIGAAFFALGQWVVHMLGRQS
jgi:hypothetical protein